MHILEFRDMIDPGCLFRVFSADSPALAGCPLRVVYDKINVIMKRYKPISLRKVKTYPIGNRKSKVATGALASPAEKGGRFSDFVSSLPGVLAASDIKAVASAIVLANREGRPVVLGMGAHPIKVGLSPLIIDLMEMGVITALATNGACTIHDFELAFAGHTSEDVATALRDGSFGMARETGRMINNAINSGVADGKGLGASVGAFIDGGRLPNKSMSLFGTASRLGLPATVHVAMGTDIIHMHPSADGAAIGEGSLRDFRLFSSVVADLEGGVYINLGSAVLLPEVFLKALTVARNLGNVVREFTTVSMDFMQHYRVRENVLGRPVSDGGVSYALTGHHEIMFPLLAAMIKEEVR